MSIIARSSIKKAMDKERTADKTRAQQLLDNELASITSKEYNPEQVALKESRLHQGSSTLLFPEVIRPK